MMLRYVETIKNIANSVSLSIPTLPFCQNNGCQFSGSREYLIINDYVFEVDVLEDLCPCVPQAEIEVVGVLGPASH